MRDYIREKKVQLEKNDFENIFTEGIYWEE